MLLQQISKDNPIPLYLQLEKVIKTAIEDGELKPGKRIPTEVELCQQYGVSRITVRNAIKLLVEQGYLYKAQGKGTMVMGRRLQRDASILTGFTDDVLRMGQKPGSKVLSVGRETPPAWVASSMNLTGKQELITLTRLRLLDDLPITIQICYLSPKLDIQLDELNQIESLYAFLHSKGIHVVQAEEILQAITVPKKFATVLEVDECSAVLLVKRTTFDDAGMPVECVEGYYHSDRYEHYSIIRRSGATGSIYHVEEP